MASINEWKTFALNDVFDYISGLSKPRSEFGFGHGFVTFKDVLDNIFVPNELTALVNSTEKERSRCSVRRGDVFLTRTSETQEDLGMSSVALKDYENATFNGFTKRLRPKPSINVVPEYAAYFFRGPKFRREMSAMSSLSTRASLNNGMLDRLTIVLPPERIQSSIGNILKSLDDKIELNRRMNETLEETARAIFKSWFIDFDPVRAKMDGRQPEGMDAATAALFPDSFEHVDGQLVPQGWKVGKVKDEFTLTMGQSPPGSTYNEHAEGLPFFQGRRDFGFRFPTRRVFCTAPTRFAEAGDTLISVRAPVGDLNMATERCCVGRGVAAIRHRTASRSYTYYAMQNLGEDFARYEAEGTVFGSINKTNFQSLELLVPGDSLVEAFENRVGSIDQRIENLTQESRNLAALRDTLLPKLLSGELRVPEAEQEVDGV